jgi:hypothetical protein
MVKGAAKEEILIPRGGGSGGNLANDLVNLANPVVINLDEVEVGKYPYVRFRFYMTGISAGNGSMEELRSRISFPKPADLNYADHVYSYLYKGYDKDGNYLYEDPGYDAGHISLEGNNITGDLEVFTPGSVANRAGSYHGIEQENHQELARIGTFELIYMGRDVYRAFNNVVYWGEEDLQEEIYANDYLPGLPNEPDYHQLNRANEFNLLIPFDGINVPDKASAVRFEIYWNIDNIIERYEGGTASPDDDIFILKNGFWEDFSIKAFIE